MNIWLWLPRSCLPSAQYTQCTAYLNQDENRERERYSKQRERVASILARERHLESVKKKIICKITKETREAKRKIVKLIILRLSRNLLNFKVNLFYYRFVSLYYL